ncbi:hypothetical protein LTR64_000051 [Lithohypha guttulata]|uniref:uncharacterized protein n=1 Tax=Lithohypha guttulata TaxID=1690604 RepID=UPI002DE08EF4|nr:hypothetical protein LTR51_007413 [Lithohypha guttulata]
MNTVRLCFLASAAIWCASTASTTSPGVLSLIVSDLPGYHLPLYRRGGRHSVHQPFNITNIYAQREHAEGRYARVSTEADGNTIERHWRNGKDGVDEHLLSGAGAAGTWYTTIQVGKPPQTLEVDIDMLNPDFYLIMTTSGRGSKYNTFGNEGHAPSNNYVHPICRTPTDVFHLRSSASSPIRLTVPVCQPGKYSSHTLASSGTILGLAPPSSSRPLSRLSKTKTLLEQLQDENLIDHNIVSIALFDSTTGVLSLGGTIAALVEEVRIRTEKELTYLDRLDIPEERAKMEAEIAGYMFFAMPPGSTHKDHFKWVDTSNMVAGWHQALMTGIWVNGVKVLKNQPVLFDINCPFIIAPADAAQTFYEATPGSRLLSSLIGDAEQQKQAQGFQVVPCLNEVKIEFELAGWRFPFGRGEAREDALFGPVGGRFSLGQVHIESGTNSSDEAVETGYCVGIVIGSTMGIRQDWSQSAMRNVWVLGEPFFRDTGVVFDMGDKKGKGARIGVRVF